MIKYFRVWKQLTSCAISSYLSNRLDSFSYFLGKLLRFGFFLILIYAIFNYTDQLAGYSKYQVLIFFLTFNLMDVLPQAFFRGIYMFRNNVRHGNFDYVLAKPVNPLFYSLTQLTDLLDIIFLLPIIGLLAYTAGQLPNPVGVTQIVAYFVFVVLGQLIILGIHIISAGLTVWTAESDNFIWLYRELMTIGRFPPEIFSPNIQLFFTFILPIIIITALPSKMLLGLFDWQSLVLSLLYATIFFVAAIIFWNLSLKKYSSASS